ncbi:MULTISPECIES: DUF6777 domain-containing protein [Streptomyces]|uniref:DUF6777 domain-containing protein n=1 Tax=Streptomyces venezuelae TaxID=54571 RepID=A0A5P2AJZ1_STRVZ|nr:DUF6777 domain-containing protein [Streptomyces venezuelae]QES18425.1 hypothetical protein DEJ46_04360 [Streptomyces venezuelae]
MRTPQRRRRRRTPTAITATLASALLVAGCTSDEQGGSHGEQPAAAAAQEVHLQPVTARGPDPFTASTARITGRAAVPERDPAATSFQRVREITGSTPGLYGGTRSEASCDVEQQVTFLSGDPARTRAFAEAAGIPEANVPGWLRGLTPVVLRADTRVTNHGYRGGRAAPFQSVLQSGTAVLVDQYGSPRVRCACGNPLRSPVTAPGGVHQGEPWESFDPEYVIVVRPTSTVVTSLVIVNAADKSWIERRTGSDGAEDRKPAVEPDCDPDACHLTGTVAPEAPAAPDSATPDSVAPAPATPEPSRPETVTPSSPDPTGPVPADPDPSGDPTPDQPADPPGDPFADPPSDPYADPREDPNSDPYGDPYTDPYTDPYADPYAEPPVSPEGELPLQELFPPDTGQEQPETFEG